MTPSPRYTVKITFSMPKSFDFVEAARYAKGLKVHEDIDVVSVEWPEQEWPAGQPLEAA
jgi:hypothetical protein